MSTPSDQRGAADHRDEPTTPSDPDVFHWPPRRQTVTASTTSLPNNRNASNPGREANVERAAPAVSSDHRRAQSTPLAVPSPTRHDASPSILEPLQRAWFDLLTPPLERRLALLGWTPDAPDDYCHRCGQTTGPAEASGDGCRHCADQRRPWSNLVRLGEYAPPLDAVVHEIKFTAWRRLARDAGRLLGEAVRDEIDARRPTMEPFLRRRPLLVPMPISFRRRIVRGIDHTLAICRGVRETLECDLVHALARRHRPSQLDVAPSSRAGNVAGTMWTRISRDQLRGRVIIVVDDVTTTGATLRAACNALRAAGRARAQTRDGTISDESPASRVRGAKRLDFCLWAAVVAVTPQGKGAKNPN